MGVNSGDTQLGPPWLGTAKGVKGPWFPLLWSTAPQCAPRLRAPAREPGGSVWVQVGGYSCMLPAWGSLCPLTPWDSCLFCSPFLLLTAPPFPGTLENI